MTAVRRSAIVVLCVVAVLLLAVKFVLPALANSLNGIGIEIPLPTSLVAAHPILTLGGLFVGVPLLLVAIVVASIYWSSRPKHAK